MKVLSIRARHSSSTAARLRGGFPGLPLRAGYAFLAGCGFAYWSTVQPGFRSLGLVALLAVAAIVWRRLAWAALFGGLLLGGLAVQQRLEARWPVARGGERVLVEGWVDSLPAHRGTALEFELEGCVIRPAQYVQALRVRVTWRGGSTAADAPRAGERWRLVLRLQPPRAAVNPGGIDQERLLFRARIDALGVVVPSTLSLRLASAGPGWGPLRQRIAERIRDSVVDRDAAALIAGLAVGATEDMTREQWRVFGVTGTVHLVAISGLHVTLFAWLATGIARRLWRLARLGGRVPREPFAAAVGVFAAAVYALLAGFSVPTQRTLVMLGTWWLARLCGRPQGGLEVIGVALLAVLLFDPLAPLAAGFWLSFAAIAVLIATPSPAGVQLIDPAAQGMPSCIQQSLPWTLRPLRWTLQALHELVATQWRVTVALAPATLLLFGSVPVAGMLANLFAIPFFSFLLVPLILVALALWPMLPSGAVVLWRVAEWLYLQSWPLLEAIAALPGALWSVQPELAWLPVGLLALPLVLLPVPVALRVTVLVALVPLLTPARIAVPAGEFLAVLLETGDGVALAVLTQRHALVYDTGDVYGSTGARAQRQLLPALQALGRRQVDLVVQSRANGFRVTGVAALLDALPVRELRSGGRWNAGPSLLRACDQAAGWIWDNVEVRLFPGAPDGAEEAAGASCVLRVAARGGLGAALLVPAQVDRGEAGLLAAGLKRQRLQAEVVLAPRGGAVNATVPAFVAAVGAQQVLVASREMAHERLERIAAQWSVSRSQVWATARDGALLIGSTPAGRGIEVSRLVALQPRWVWRVPRD